MPDNRRRETGDFPLHGSFDRSRLEDGTCSNPKCYGDLCASDRRAAPQVAKNACYPLRCWEGSVANGLRQPSGDDEMASTGRPYDESLLRKAFDVARRSREGGDHPFGSLLADRDGNVLLEQCNGYSSEGGDRTAHAERLLATRAPRSRHNHSRRRLRNVTLRRPARQPDQPRRHRAGRRALVLERGTSSSELASLCSLGNCVR